MWRQFGCACAKSYQMRVEIRVFSRKKWDHMHASSSSAQIAQAHALIAQTQSKPSMREWRIWPASSNKWLESESDMSLAAAIHSTKAGTAQSRSLLTLTYLRGKKRLGSISANLMHWLPWSQRAVLLWSPLLSAVRTDRFERQAQQTRNRFLIDLFFSFEVPSCLLPCMQ